MLTTVLRDMRVRPPAAIDAEVVIDFPDSQFPDVEAAWTAERGNLPASAEHVHWDWVRKLGSPNYRFVAITVGTSVEGLMAVARSPRPSRLTAGVQTLYVSFLEAAPWNLPMHPSGIRFRGCGKSLLAVACRMSETDGFGGRVLLSSLPQAESFYRACGMTECGIDHGLLYFEYREADAAALRARVGI